MKVLRKDYYENDISKIGSKDFPLKDIKESTVLNYSSSKILPVNKKSENSYGTFDDGLLFQFPQEKYKHLTYWCKTDTDNLDTCNVKLFKLQDFAKAEDEKKNRKWAPPLTRNETILFARLGYHQYFKVNFDVDSMLYLRQKNGTWYKFDYIFSYEDHMISVFINDKLNTSQPFHMG